MNKITPGSRRVPKGDFVCRRDDDDSRVEKVAAWIALVAPVLAAGWIVWRVFW